MAPVNEPARPAYDSTFVYTVKAGDNFNGIAYRNHSTPKQLEKDNPTVYPGFIKEGQKLNVSTYKTSTWTAYENAQKEYDKYLSDKFERERQEMASKKETPVQQKKHNCPNFLDDPIGWLGHRWLCH